MMLVSGTGLEPATSIMSNILLYQIELPALKNINLRVLIVAFTKVGSEKKSDFFSSENFVVFFTTQKFVYLKNVIFASVKYTD